jgi:Glycosyltransferase like family
MIVFGCAITDPPDFERFAEPGIRLASEPDSEVLAMGSAGSIFRNYNLLLDRVRDREDLEALVLLHQDTEIVDPDLCAKLREAFADPDVAIVGCAGAVGVRSIAWWEGSVTWSGFMHRYHEEGGGDIPALTWEEGEVPSFARLGEVDTIDGFLMGMSPWAVRNLRFDETLGRIHGYDLDICLQARAAGKKVMTGDFRAIHHHDLDMIRGVDGWVEAHIKVAEKWDGRVGDVGTGAGDWKQRARRAEAEAAAERMVAFAAEHIWNARVQARDNRLEEMESSLSWRLTAPLRWVKRLLLMLRRGG